MIPKAKELKLISIYLYICELYNDKLKHSCQRHSNNANPEFTDQEILTIYLFAMSHEQKFKITHIYNYAKDYMLSWFPKLPSYIAFNTRLNRLSVALQQISESLLTNFQPSDCKFDQSLLDSLPIITCSGKRSGKVAREIIDKGFCATKNMYYFGLKLHALGFRRPNRLPFPEELVLSAASENDLNIYKMAWSTIENRKFFGDKIYIDHDYFLNIEEKYNSQMLTPVKGIKGQPDCIKMRDKAANDLYSSAVSAIRQPIESLFNWLIEKTDIQRASKVRSTKGLLVHVFGRIAAAYIFLIFNS